MSCLVYAGMNQDDCVYSMYLVIIFNFVGLKCSCSKRRSVLQTKYLAFGV